MFMVPALLSESCVEPYYPELDRYEDVLVVDGTFTNIDEDRYVYITRTYGYYEVRGSEVTGAVVMVRNGDGITATYTEESPGTYVLPAGSMEGEIGKEYQLLIETSDGSQYASSYQKLKKPARIDSVYYEKEEILRLSDSPLKGLRVYVNGSDPENETHYYQWEFSETWEFNVAFQKPGYDNKYTCWRSNDSKSINIATTTQLTEDLVYRQPLNFISTENPRLSNMYSLNVRQLALPQEAYDFWRKLELANEHTGSLFDPPPTPVTGNIENINDPEEPILGYFRVAGASEKRIFISREELPTDLNPATGNEHCEYLEVVGEGIDELQHGWYLLTRFTFMDMLWTSLSSHVDCYDCTQKGTNIKPEFWIDPDE